MDILIKDISQLLTVKKNRLRVIRDAFLDIRDGKIFDYGSQKNSKLKTQNAKRNPVVISANNCVVMPGFVDCHTHLVFAGFREKELEERLAGKSYREITKSGGGILNTVNATRKASFFELLTQARQRIREAISWGVTTLEIKSGYGLDTENELKILRVIRKLREEGPIDIVPTFLGAHALPREKTKEEYVDEIINKMLPRVSCEKLAVFCDVFCEKGFFSASDAERILRKAKSLGLLIKIHADEITSSGGTEVGIKVGAVSCDHVIYPSNKGIAGMAKKGICAVLLPGTVFFLKSKKRPPVHKLREYKVPIAIASDFNPGTCPINKMPLITALASFVLNLTMEEAIIGATQNAAKALRLDKRVGSIRKGKDADCLILNIPDYRFLFYNFGENPVRMVIKRGKVIYHQG